MSDSREEALRLIDRASVLLKELTQDGMHDATGALQWALDALPVRERLARAQPHSRQEGEISERPAGGASNADSGSPPPQQEPAAWIADIAAYADHRKTRCIVFSKDELMYIEDGKTAWTPLYASPRALSNYEPCLSVGRCRWNEQAGAEGFVLVPMEPPQEMLDAWTRKSMLRASVRECYQAMLSAAPQPATKREGE